MQLLSKEGLGGSEIPMVVGLSPFGSAWDVYAAKVHGRLKDLSEPMEWGLRLEPAIRAKYCDTEGCTVVVPWCSLFHPRRPWQRATPDGMIYLGAGEEDLALLRRMSAEQLAEAPPDRLLQAKNVSEWMGRLHWDGTPDYVQAQVQWEMSVTGAAACDVASLVGGNHFHVDRIHRDESFIDDLLAIGGEFMERVAAGVPPEIDESDACRAHFQGRLSRSSVEKLADEEAELVIRAWKAAHVAAKAAEVELATARNRVLAAYAAAETTTLRTSEGVLSLRAEHERTSTDYKTVAELVASAARMPAAEMNALIESATTKTKVAATPSAPKAWAKEIS